MVDFQYKEMKNLKILPKDTSKYIFMSIYQYMDKYESHDKYTLLNNIKKNVITNHDSTMMSKRIAKFKSNYKNVRI